MGWWDKLSINTLKMNKPELPIESIGEDSWVDKLTLFLEEYDVEVEGVESVSSTFPLPDYMKDYYTFFGGIESSDFMYQLYKPDDFVLLSESNWSFVAENFSSSEIEKFVVFSESPGNDPVCINSEDNTIHLFSHDPLKGQKVFEDFNQYLQYEIIELQKLMGDIDWSKEEEIEYHKEKLGGSNIDYSFRYMKFC